MVWDGISVFLVAAGQFFVPNCTKLTILYDKMPNGDPAAASATACFAGWKEAVLLERAASIVALTGFLRQRFHRFRP